MTYDLIHTGFIQGIILTLIAFGIMIPFRFLNFPDLTAEGAYPLGAASCSVLILSGMHPFWATLVALFLSGIMAIGTAQITLRLNVNSLLAGIILSTMAYSINLKIMGKPNLALFENDATFFSAFNLSMLVSICVILFFLFLKTDFGLRFRAIGLNPHFAKRSNICVETYTRFGLFIAGGLYGLAGSLMAQMQQFVDVGMGVGIVIHGLASLMVGESILGNHTLLRQLIAPVLGSIVYQQIQGIVLSLGLQPSDLKLFTGIIVLFVLYMNSIKKLENS